MPSKGQMLEKFRDYLDKAGYVWLDDNQKELV